MESRSPHLCEIFVSKGRWKGEGFVMLKSCYAFTMTIDDYSTGTANSQLVSACQQMCAS